MIDLTRWTRRSTTALTLASVLSVALLGGCQRRDATAAASATNAFEGVDITGADYGRALALNDQHGTRRTLADFKGKVVAVFFGYTQCPDACPTTMADLAATKKALGADGAKLQAVFVTVDPERDTPDVLQRYMGSFDPSFVGLRGTAEQTAAVAKEFKVYYAKSAGSAPGSYSVDHTAGTYLIDPTGHVRVFERYGVGAPVLAGDVRRLLQGV